MSCNEIRPLSALGRSGRSGSGVRVSKAIRSAIRRTETRVCCQESKTWDSCWIGEKNMSM